MVQDQEVALSPIGLTGAKPISGATLSARGEVAVLEGQPGHMSLDCWLRIHIPRMCAVLSGALHVPIMVLFLGVFKYSFIQARILELGAIASSRGFSRPRDQTCVSCTGR